ncbi:ABC transporter permease [Anseongella ginsenosidimutans]|uniref:ABC transporter permease n=1 Tax=Anseongella ginsenosidimutans TaxID=496056 RepID=UPI001CEF6615|nr:ABC transporter permease [Anseongella ginsenosidimutans]
MKQLFVFIRKEFYHVFRDRRTLLIMFGLPVVQILLFGFALTSEVKNADILVVDNAGDAQSTQLINKITASSYFTMKGKAAGYKDVEAAFKEGTLSAPSSFPPGSAAICFTRAKQAYRSSPMVPTRTQLKLL